MKFSYYTHLEWIDDNQELQIKKLKNLDFFYLENCSEAVLFRDYDYKLKLKISGELKGTLNNIREDIMNSHFGITIYGSSDYEITQYVINDCNISNLNSKFNLNENGHSKDIIELIYFVNGPVNIEHNSHVESDSKLLTEWYLNGAKILFPRSTDRKYTKYISRSRYGIDDDEYISMKYPSENGSRDCCYFDCGEIKFIVFTTLKEVGPEWSINFGIEYRYEWGIPNKETRDSIAEIISFFFGTQLLNVGYSISSTNHYPIKSSLKNPPGDNVQTICRTNKNSPLGIDYYHDLAIQIESTLIGPINKYLELSDTLRLNEVLWRYWIGKRMPIGTNLPILASGLEVLANSWINSELSNGSSVYLEKEEYLNLISDELESLSSKLDNYDFKEKILNKFKHAFNTGVNEKLEVMFQELGIELSRQEKKALQARNKMAHGASMETDQKIREAIKLSYIYLTLYEKVFLKIIGYEGLHRIQGSSDHEMIKI